MWTKPLGAILALVSAFALGRYTQWEASAEKRMREYEKYSDMRIELTALKPALADCRVKKEFYRESLNAVNSAVVRDQIPSLEGYPFDLEFAKKLGMGGN